MCLELYSIICLITISKVEVKPIYAAIYLVQHYTMEELLSLLIKKSDHKHYLGVVRDMTLHLDLSKGAQKKGGFKLASFGMANHHLFGASFDICTKQTFYTAIQESEGKVKLTQNIPHDNITQICNLAMEIVCLVWGQVLLDLVYMFVKKCIVSCGNPPFPIPKMWFVDAALAVEHITGEDMGCAFLLVETIEDQVKFRKYMNNVSAVPLSFNQNEDTKQAKFLVFMQHVQYYKTRKLAFISDYQGKLLLCCSLLLVSKSLITPCD